MVDGHLVHRADQIAAAKNRIAADRDRSCVADRSSAVTADGCPLAVDIQTIFARRRTRPDNVMPTTIAQSRGRIEPHIAAWLRTRADDHPAGIFGAPLPAMITQSLDALLAVALDKNVPLPGQ